MTVIIRASGGVNILRRFVWSCLSSCVVDGVDGGGESNFRLYQLGYLPCSWITEYPINSHTKQRSLVLWKSCPSSRATRAWTWTREQKRRSLTVKAGLDGREEVRQKKGNGRIGVSWPLVILDGIRYRGRIFQKGCFIVVSSTTPCEDTRAKNMNFLRRMNLVGQLTIPTGSHHPKW